ncbi:MAG: glycosyltransferase [Rhodospirillaceae bacterium]|nr:glycosyltransferase [Rhodospirillaceae bacterium]
MTAAGPAVSIVIVNYRTPDLTRLCLRLIRKHTDPGRARVIVVDNASGDASTDYLRSLDWITLIERTPEPGEPVAINHGRAVDLALAQVDTPFALLIHTDTFVRHAGWLDLLMAPMADPKVGGVGSWKLDLRPAWQRSFKRAERAVQRVVFPLIGKGYGHIEGLGENYYYLRSHCALYRMAPLRQLGLGMVDDTSGLPPGKRLHRQMEEAGWTMVFLPPRQLMRAVIHADHATMILNPELGMKAGSRARGLKRLQRVMDELGATAILADESLDR